MKAKEFVFHITWMWLWVGTTVIGVSMCLDYSGPGYIALFGLFMGGLQAGVQATLLAQRFSDLVYGVDQ